MKLTINNKAVIIVLIGLIVTNFFTYYFTTNNTEHADAIAATDTSSDIHGASGCPLKIKMLNGYDYIKPVLFADKECESERLTPIKQTIDNLIGEYKKFGVLNSASVFLKEYTANEWIAINSEEKFLPGSLMKVPLLITVLKMEEANPGFLNKKLLYRVAYDSGKDPKFKSQKAIIPGNTYTVGELLKYMIVHSDNNATSLLFANTDVKIFKKVFTDMGLKVPDVTSANYPITAKEFSIFMGILYNSSYLNNKNSEFATELLTASDFKDGIVGGLPNEVKTAHKFGEAGDPREKNFSESAIVYLGNNPYVLTVMLKGKSYDQLPGIMKEISGIVYQNMKASSKAASL